MTISQKAGSKTGSLAAICAGAAMLMTVPMAHAGNAGVNMIYPPKRASDFDKAAPAPVATKTVVKVKVYVHRNTRKYLRERRRFYVERALFQNYTGFRKVYGGRNYPF